MGEITVGSRFYYKDKLCEVVEYESEFKCLRCTIYGDRKNCEKMLCFADSRHDGKSVFYRKVEE